VLFLPIMYVQDKMLVWQGTRARICSTYWIFGASYPLVYITPRPSTDHPTADATAPGKRLSPIISAPVSEPTKQLLAAHQAKN